MPRGDPGQRVLEPLGNENDLGQHDSRYIFQKEFQDHGETKTVPLMDHSEMPVGPISRTASLPVYTGCQAPFKNHLRNWMFVTLYMFPITTFYFGIYIMLKFTINKK